MSSRLSLEEGKNLVKLARQAVETRLKSGEVMDVPDDLPKRLLEKSGVFVTISSLRHGRRELRGCIGLPYPTNVLANAVIQSAISAATQDPRFHPVSTGELDHIIFEISVLTPPQLIEVERPQTTHQQ